MRTLLIQKNCQAAAPAVLRSTRAAVRVKALGGFAGRFATGAVVAFLVTVAGVSIFNIGAAFWGLVFGVVVSRIVEPGDFTDSQKR